jgi:hypothetical protein
MWAQLTQPPCGQSLRLEHAQTNVMLFFPFFLNTLLLHTSLLAHLSVMKTTSLVGLLSLAVASHAAMVR